MNNITLDAAVAAAAEARNRGELSAQEYAQTIHAAHMKHNPAYRADQEQRERAAQNADTMQGGAGNDNIAPDA